MKLIIARTSFMHPRAAAPDARASVVLEEGYETRPRSNVATCLLAAFAGDANPDVAFTCLTRC
jgi:hypothetical protein